MIVVRSLDELRREKNSIVTVGTFDGVHLAHQEIVREVVERARARGCRSVVLTFDPHPKEIVGTFKEPIHLLTTISERIELLAALGVDVLFVIQFTLEFSQQRSHEFYERYLVHGTGVREVVVGYDHKFGMNRQGSTEELVRMGEEFDFSVFSFHPYTVKGEIVSSTQIRRALNEGSIDRANAFLGRPYSLRGTVVPGDGRGRTIGYPTANIEPENRTKLIPANGVYLVAARLEEKKCFGMMNIGMRPTMTNGARRVLEVHLFDFADQIYDRRIEISFLKKLRNEQKFSSVHDLVSQLGSDKEQSLKFIAESLHRL